jgi:hypothetical protein
VHATVITLPEPDEIDDRPFEAAIRVRIEAMVTLSSLVFATHRRRIVDLAGRHSLKTKPPHDVVRPPGGICVACVQSIATDDVEVESGPPSGGTVPSIRGYYDL